MLELQPLTYAEACEYIRLHHRHHEPPQGHKFSIGCSSGGVVVGVIMVGRPVARHLDDTWTAEVTRCCTDSTKNVASKLYAAAWRAARAMGYKRLITYTLKTEPGTSVRAAGWRVLNSTAGGGSWNRKERTRVDKHPLGQKTLWQAGEGARDG